MTISRNPNLETIAAETRIKYQALKGKRRPAWQAKYKLGPLRAGVLCHCMTCLEDRIAPWLPAICPICKNFLDQKASLKT